eukprot:g2701.t1
MPWSGEHFEQILKLENDAIYGDITRTLNDAGDKRCGIWQEDFVENTQRTSQCGMFLAGIGDFTVASCVSQNQGTVVYAVSDHSRLGYADILTGLVSAFLLAVLSRRSFHIHWSSARNIWEPQLPNLFVDMEDTYPNWREKAVNTVDRPRHRWESYPDLGDLFPKRVHIDDARWQYYSRVDFNEVFQDPVLVLMSNRGQTYAAYENPVYKPRLEAMGLKDPDDAFGCLLRVLIRPKISLFRQYEAATTTSSVFRAIRSPRPLYTIGVHLRAGYALRSRIRHLGPGEARLLIENQFASTFRCARDLYDEEYSRSYNKRTNESFLCPRIRDIAWIVFGDEIVVRDAARSIAKDMGIHAIVPDVSVVGHSAGVMEKGGMGSSTRLDAFLGIAVVEHWILSLCDRLVIPRNTGFSKTAAFLGLMKGRVHVAGPPHFANSSKLAVSGLCVDKHATSFRDLAYDLAHI